MKIEQLIVQHLYNNKELSLQGFGTFKLKPKEDASQEENDTVLQQEKDIIEFTYDPKTTEDNALLHFIMQQTGKMKALAAADIESYLVLAKQFINIGKPFVIEGIGTLQKSQQGDYLFAQGAFVASRADEQPKPLKEKQEEPISFKQEITSFITKRNIQIAGIILGIIVISITLTYLIVRKKDEPVAQPAAPIIATPAPVDTTAKTIDSTNKVPKDTVATTVVAPVQLPPVPLTQPGVHDTNIHFKVIIKSYPTLDSAENAYRRVRSDGYKVNIYPDGSKYTLGLPCKCPITDSTMMKDSIHMVFGGSTRIELP